ncbi:bifunctional phosphopantothenoylcysteine decarboxylase/phosphopantothenate--cysteine ligase CoaBC [Desulfurobacterium indicum]|uniref:Coenzyme A biosynthesis bifunctional protein CoaBC n=1 Tax=Desulfurobacterium indicum TaxID=1914305 RepID=A0A1R1ML40_9BACT|nr:bifunctional phosphopantothenoylcysteine decarboxylase/phosphopantothenate--cysteine ligase CoaBC [Desulfurobacterium indicum]OMH40522.1 bifunctional 4'-phosphopantothenoylcysteine decarboxylase/phosphopantothenoylcysteine synthetase [Desulfurobacterium indicum]
MERTLEGKKILLGITGSIAAYKAIEILRELQKKGADVYTAVTPNGLEFVSEVVLRTLSGHSVYKEIVPKENPEIRHTSLASSVDLFVVAPATGNTIAKIAHGIADNPVTASALAIGKGIICPAMNVKMYENPATVDNIELLKKRGYKIVDSDEGELACGVKGKGRLAKIETIVEAVEDYFIPKFLKDKKVVITAGPTREYIDPVRFISNPSSGKMGYELARIARAAGALVTLISGKTCLNQPYGVNYFEVETVEDMRKAVMDNIEGADIYISAAAINDYRPVRVNENKIKKSDSKLVLELERTPDILAEVASKRLAKCIVGFAAETENLIENARKKLKSKRLTMVVANDVKGKVFGEDETECMIIGENFEERVKGSKRQVALEILKLISQKL